MNKRWFVTTLVVLAITAVACVGEEQVSWTDDFSDPASGWQAESDASAEVGYSDGVMLVRIKAPNRLAWASAGG